MSNNETSTPSSTAVPAVVSSPEETKREASWKLPNGIEDHIEAGTKVELCSVFLTSCTSIPFVFVIVAELFTIQNYLISFTIMFVRYIYNRPYSFDYWYFSGWTDWGSSLSIGERHACRRRGSWIGCRTWCYNGKGLL